MKQLQIKQKKPLTYLLAFLVPVTLMLLVSILLRIYPFGDTTILINDMNDQYVNFLTYFKTLFGSGPNNFFYTFSKNLGGDMIGFTAYYLISPVNLIALFFPNHLMPVAAWLIIVIKVGLAGLTTCYFLNHSQGFSMKTVIFSTAYALMSYTMCYFFTIIWLDCIVLFPLMVLGIDRIVDGNRPWLYMLSLFGAFMTNYYIGFMFCIFSVIYLIYKLALKVEHWRDLKQYRKQILIWVIFSITAACLTMIVLFPTAKTLQGGRASFSLGDLTLSENYSFIEVFTKMFAFTINRSELSAGLPNIFAGTLVTGLTILYFFNSEIKLRERLLSAFVIAIFLLSFHVRALNLVWHGFSPPQWFPYRYSFMFSFFMIFLAYRCFINLKGLTYKNIISGFLIFLGAIIVIFREPVDYVSIKSVYMALVVLVTSFFIYYFIKSDYKHKRLLLLIIVLMQVGELSFNALYSIRQLQTEFPYSMKEFVSETEHIQEAVDFVQEKDTGLYRMEKTFQRSKNDTMQFDYYGLNHFSSSEKYPVRRLMQRLGIRDTGALVTYGTGSTVTADSFLGMKYLLSRSGTNKDYQLLDIVDGISIYQNSNALPIAFGVSDKVLQYDIPELVTFGSHTYFDLFSFQNEFFETMSNGSYENLFSSAKIVDMTTENLVEIKEAISIKEALENGNRSYQKINDSQDAYIEYTIEIEQEDELYFFASAPGMQDGELYVNGQALGSYFENMNWGIKSLGNFKEGDLVTLRIQVLNKEPDPEETLAPMFQLTNVYFYYENAKVVDDFFSQLNTQGATLELISSSHLKGDVTITKENQQLLFTFPYDEGWTVWIDGEKVEPVETFTSLLSVPIDKGEHQIELKFFPTGLKLGALVTFGTVAILIGYVIYHRRKRKKA